MLVARDQRRHLVEIYQHSQEEYCDSVLSADQCLVCCLLIVPRQSSFPSIHSASAMTGSGRANQREGTRGIRAKDTQILHTQVQMLEISDMLL